MHFDIIIIKNTKTKNNTTNKKKQETKDQLLKNMGKLMKSEHELPETETEALAQVII